MAEMQPDLITPPPPYKLNLQIRIDSIQSQYKESVNKPRTKDSREQRISFVLLVENVRIFSTNL